MQDAAPPSAVAARGEHAPDGAPEATDAGDEHDAPAQEDSDDEDEGGVWETASLYEEILDEVEAFEYSDNGEYGLDAPLRMAANIYGRRTYMLC